MVPEDLLLILPAAVATLPWSSLPVYWAEDRKPENRRRARKKLALELPKGIGLCVGVVAGLGLAIAALVSGWASIVMLLLYALALAAIPCVALVMFCRRQEDTRRALTAALAGGIPGAIIGLGLSMFIASMAYEPGMELLIVAFTGGGFILGGFVGVSLHVSVTGDPVRKSSARKGALVVGGVCLLIWLVQLVVRWGYFNIFQFAYGSLPVIAAASIGALTGAHVKLARTAPRAEKRPGARHLRR